MGTRGQLRTVLIVHGEKRQDQARTPELGVSTTPRAKIRVTMGGLLWRGTIKFSALGFWDSQIQAQERKAPKGTEDIPKKWKKHGLRGVGLAGYTTGRKKAAAVTAKTTGTIRWPVLVMKLNECATQSSGDSAARKGRWWLLLVAATANYTASAGSYPARSATTATPQT